MRFLRTCTRTCGSTSRAAFASYSARLSRRVGSEMQSDEWLPRTHGVAPRYANTRSQKEPTVPAGGTGNGHIAGVYVPPGASPRAATTMASHQKWARMGVVM